MSDFYGRFRSTKACIRCLRQLPIAQFTNGQGRIGHYCGNCGEPWRDTPIVSSPLMGKARVNYRRNSK